MSYTFGDATASTGYTLGTSDAGFNYGGQVDYGFDLATQDFSIDDFAYTPVATVGSGWDSVTNTLGSLWDTAGDLANTYLNKVIDREVYGDTRGQVTDNQRTVTPVNTTDATQAGFAIDNKTLMIGGAAIVALIFLAKK